MTTLIVDGSNLSSAHFTTNPALDLNGIPIGSIKGTLNSIAYTAQTLKATRIILFFDGKDGSLQRRKIKKDYKSGRRPLLMAGRHYVFSNEEKLTENKKWQHEILIKLIDLLPVNCIVTNGYEADDGIGYLIKHKKYFNLGITYILSSDKDFFQLVDSDVFIYNPQLKQVLDAAAIRAKHGVRPQHWALYRAVSGDPADNISGVGGVGEKKFQDIFDALDKELSPEDIVENLSENKAYSKLLEKKELIEENFKLVNLKDPMMSLHAKEHVENKIKNFEPKFKKFEFLRELISIGITTNFNVYDTFLRIVK